MNVNSSYNSSQLRQWVFRAKSRIEISADEHWPVKAETKNERMGARSMEDLLYMLLIREHVLVVSERTPCH